MKYKNFTINLNIIMITFFLCFCSYAQSSQKMPLLIDISDDTERHVEIAERTGDVCQVRPATLLLPDGETIFCVCNIVDGGNSGLMAVSHNGGITWKRIDERLPASFSSHENCPSIYRMRDMQSGKTRLWIFSASPSMPRIMSEDGGKTWTEKNLSILTAL
ncbi:hypothetical protein L21SP3_00906 [Sedimentisphaera cyanobacteriorum]|uniref:Neuraminidase (Sialidase) n=1 Tax=Sedimentisphaera cyanobacteriorum TaxID=1940790 RepID=A0A1Q2HPB1_9BACT|nr:sialidase family protein [Sedimentisphaera cyanobacteriorum]AQQ09106.1 hypothetical protein L21SP3_00906 [Sedimentisphaera cyanobacteriorum]